jgi:hypothetical protein
MRTITDSMFRRLEAQAKEAKVLGLNKTAANLEYEVDRHSDHVRENDSLYSYTKDEVNEDVQKHIWDAIVRIADFYGSTVDASSMQDKIEQIASDLIRDVGVNIGIKDGVGAYEPLVPGEHREHISIELKDE